MKMQTRWTKTWSPAEALGTGSARSKTGLIPMPSMMQGICRMQLGRQVVTA